MAMKIKIQKMICKRCGHEWVPRKEEVIICPKCKGQGTVIKNHLVDEICPFCEGEGVLW